jgi:AcrR family transcriptional regulator
MPENITLVSTQLSEIAAEAGAQCGSLYYHFESREELIEEVLLEGAAVRAYSRRRGRNAARGYAFGTPMRSHSRPSQVRPG